VDGTDVGIAWPALLLQYLGIYAAGLDAEHKLVPPLSHRRGKV